MIRLDGVSLMQGRTVAVERVNAAFGPGLSAVAGPNGAGKTTLLRAMAGLHPLAAGHISGMPPASEVALLPQLGGLDRRFPITARELVTFGAWADTGPFSRLSAAGTARVDAAMARMGLTGLGHRMIAALSAGQFQRVLFARLIVQDAPVILLDEPFTAVDAATEADILDLLAEWRDQGRTVIAVLHDREMILRHFPTTLLLAREAVAFGPSAEVLSDANRHTARLLSEGWMGIAA
jgi:zinc/manganese transport system ATP-binding protein